MLGSSGGVARLARVARVCVSACQCMLNVWHVCVSVNVFSVFSCDKCTMYVEVDESARGEMCCWGGGGRGSGEQNNELPLDRTEFVVTGDECSE